VAHAYLVDDLVDTEPGALVVVTGPEARHAVTVSRVRPGEALRLGDGRGLVVHGEVVEAAPDRLVLRADRVHREAPPPRRTVLVQALAKGDRDELAVQAATELGVDEVVPWAAARSVSRWQGPKVDKGLTRWRSIVREASKQAVRSHVPTVAPLAGLRDLVGRASGSLVLVLDPAAEHPLSGVDLTAHDGDVVVVVGPEGGIAPHELEELAAAGALPVRLGGDVLRTSTAGPAALAVLAVGLGRW